MMDKGKKHPARKVVRHLLRRDPRLSLPARFFDLASSSAQSGEEFEITFFENILEKDPCNEDALMFLGHAYTRLGQYEKGLSFDERLVRLRPADPTASTASRKPSPSAITTSLTCSKTPTWNTFAARPASGA